MRNFFSLLKNVRTKSFSKPSLIFGLFFTFCSLSSLSLDFSDDAERLMQKMFDDGGKGWYCEWQLYMPDRLPGDASNNNVVGMSGISGVKFEKGYIDSNNPSIFLVLDNFLSEYILRAKVGYKTEIRKEEFGIAPWMAYDKDRSKTVMITHAGALEKAGSHNYVNVSSFLGAVRENYLFDDCKIDVDGSNGLTISINRGSSGNLLFKDWDGKSLKITDDRFADVWYFDTLTLRFVKSDEGRFSKGRIEYSRPYGNGAAKTNSYVADIETGDNVIKVRNMYGFGCETAGDVLKYNHNAYTLSPSCFELTVAGDNCEMQGAFAPMLTLSPFTGKYNKDRENMMQMSVGDNMHYFQNYLCVSESQFAQLDIPVYSEYMDDLDAFYEKLTNTVLETPSGRISPVSTADIPNYHWDRENGQRASQYDCLEFDPHYLIPLRYYYYSSATSKYFDYYFRPYKPGIVKVERLSVGIPGTERPSASVFPLSFELKDYGNGKISESDNNVYIYLTGKISTVQSDPVDLYIVRGTIADYEAAELADTETGHTDALLISVPEYDASRIRDEENTGDVLDALSDVNSYGVACLVPRDAINGESDDETYTVFAGYTDTDGSTRFRKLTELNPTNQTTTKSPSLIKRQAPAYRMSGNTVTAVDGCLEVYSATGRLVAKLSTKQEVKLMPGIYVVSHQGKTDKIVIRY